MKGSPDRDAIRFSGFGAACQVNSPFAILSSRELRGRAVQNLQGTKELMGSNSD
jgi:hypothetical protein